MGTTLENPLYYKARLVSETFIKDDGSQGTKLVRDTALFDDGLYFVERVDGFTLKFAKSRDDIYNGKYKSVDTAVTITDSTIQPYETFSKTLKPQKIT